MMFLVLLLLLRRQTEDVEDAAAATLGQIDEIDVQRLRRTASQRVVSMLIYTYLFILIYTYSALFIP